MKKPNSRLCATLGVCLLIGCALIGSWPYAMHAQSSPPAATHNAALRQFEDRWWAFYLKNNPESATQLGEYQYNDQLSQYSPEYFVDLRKQSAALLADLNAINLTNASEADDLDRKLLLGWLEDQIKF